MVPEKTEEKPEVSENKQEIIETYSSIEDMEAKNTTKTAKITPVETLKEEKVVVQGFDIDRLARAVAKHETGNCTLGYGASHNNCFGIKHGNTAPCPGVPKMKMCRYNTPEESYEAFKIIWQKWYNGMPNYSKAKKWSGNDNAQAWLNNVTYFYNNDTGK